jgi:predicted phosphate transport protein (TIGR00153 family)
MPHREHFRTSIIDTLPSPPFKILMAHFDRVCASVQKLNEMIEFYIEGDFTEASNVSVEISRLEHEADEIKRHLRATMPRMILMPVSRGDLLEILTHNERIADSAQDVAQILDMRETAIPEELQPMLKSFLNHIVDSVMALRKMMDHLGHVFESAFARIETDEMIDLGHHVHEHEYKADSIGKQLSKATYALEGEVSPLTVVHILRFTDVMDRVADNAENSALKIVLVVSK